MYIGVALLLKDKIMKRIIIDPDTGCWNWQGAKLVKGYGYLETFGGKKERVHRLTYRIFIGKIPEDLEPDHTCKNKGCANPWHLEMVTHKENIRRAGYHPNQNVGKTHCPRGHSYNEENTRIDKRGKRICRACRRVRYIIKGY